MLSQDSAKKAQERETIENNKGNIKFVGVPWGGLGSILEALGGVLGAPGGVLEVLGGVLRLLEASGKLLEASRKPC